MDVPQAITDRRTGAAGRLMWHGFGHRRFLAQHDRRFFLAAHGSIFWRGRGDATRLGDASAATEVIQRQGSTGEKKAEIKQARAFQAEKVETPSQCLRLQVTPGYRELLKTPVCAEQVEAHVR